MSHDIEYGSHLYQAPFKREFLREHEVRELTDAFGGRGLITGVLNTVNDGKEATVYRCAADPALGVRYVAAKVYRSRKFRAFRNDGDYLRGHAVPDRRRARAVARRTNLGRATIHAAWVEREWETLTRLHDAGADVPRPYDRSSDAILMEYLGGDDDDDDDRPALRLIDVRLAPAEAPPALDRLLGNVEVMLRCDRVHGDLSAYNALYCAGAVRVIDLPQAVDARTCPSARDLLARDVRNVCAHFARYGLRRDPAAIATDLWTRYVRGEL